MEEQKCRGCGVSFSYDPDADYCPSCAAENAGRLGVALVCPNCGGGRLGTIERAYIWQSAEFTITSDGTLERADGRRVEVEWDAYDSDDVGDTETVGYCCKDCIFTWQEINDEAPAFVPFVTEAEWLASRPAELPGFDGVGLEE